MNGRNRWLTVGLTAFAVTLPTLTTSGGQRVQYGWKWVKGRSYDVRLVADSNVAEAGGGQPVRSQVSLGLAYRLDVRDVDAQGEAMVDCAVTWVRFGRKSDMTETVYDSTDKDHPIPPDALGAGPASLMGETFTVRLTRQARVQEIQGLETIRRNVESKLPEGPARQQAMQGLAGSQLEQFIRDYLLHPLAVYPSTPVGVGDSWDRRETWGGGPYDRAMTWTLRSRENGTAIIDANMAIILQVRPDPGPPAVSGQGRGQIEVDEATGRILHSRSTETMYVHATAGSPVPALKTESIITFEMTERGAGSRR